MTRLEQALDRLRKLSEQYQVEFNDRPGLQTMWRRNTMRKAVEYITEEVERERSNACQE